MRVFFALYEAIYSDHVTRTAEILSGVRPLRTLKKKPPKNVCHAVHVADRAASIK